MRMVIVMSSSFQLSRTNPRIDRDPASMLLGTVKVIGSGLNPSVHQVSRRIEQSANRGMLHLLASEERIRATIEYRTLNIILLYICKKYNSFIRLWDTV